MWRRPSRWRIASVLRRAASSQWRKLVRLVAAGDEKHLPGGRFLRRHVYLHLRETIGRPALITVRGTGCKRFAVEPHVKPHHPAIRQAKAETDTVRNLRNRGFWRGGRRWPGRLHCQFDLGARVHETFDAHSLFVQQTAEIRARRDKSSAATAFFAAAVTAGTRLSRPSVCG